MKNIFLIILFLIAAGPYTYGQQSTYINSIQAYQKKYVKEHAIVKGKDKASMQFFTIDEKYNVKARFEKVYEMNWFDMETSGKIKQSHRIYGILYFTLNDTTLSLNVYQSKMLMGSKEYDDYLFVPFTDKTNGNETYDNGRYIDLKLKDIEGGRCLLDFNKAYNPYCAYITNVFNCPIPPKENDLSVAIKAGEMNYTKSH